MQNQAKSLETKSCGCSLTGSKLDLRSQHKALLLSVNAKILCGLFLLSLSSIASWIVKEAAINSNKLMEKKPTRYSGNLYLQATPPTIYPPNPCSQASE